MPTYEYRCPNGHDFEKFFRSISSAEAESAIACPVCGAIALRQMSSAGLMFKGSGFYLTDYGKNAHGKKAPPATAGNTEGSTSGGAESSGDSGKPSGGSGESGGGGGDSSGGSGESKSGGAASSSGGDGAGKSESKKSSKPASTPTKPSSGKPSE
jgi:putative FmdB family regulatory protein